MAQEEGCPKCGSAEWIPNVGLFDAQMGQLQAEVQVKPEAWLFKEGQRAELKANICEQCGFVELYTSNPRRLMEAYRKRNQS